MIQHANWRILTVVVLWTTSSLTVCTHGTVAWGQSKLDEFNNRAMAPQWTDWNTPHQLAPRLIPNDTLFGEQWHLRNTGQSGGTLGADVNVTDVWDNYLGNGVVIAIVDDGLEHAHPDLNANYSPGLSFDYNDNDANPQPFGLEFHGTAVAGVAAARGINNLGVTGASPSATLAGVRLIAAPTTDVDEAAGLGHMTQAIDIYNNSWGPFDDAARLEGPGPQTRAALASAVASGRNGLGNIYVWAAGNGLLSNDNVNYDGYANSRYTIAVGAVDHNGVQAAYSEPGAAMLVTAYSDDGTGITTTSRVGQGLLSDNGNFDYTTFFGGTSSSAPLASGVIGLILESSPNLGYRDVQHILVNSAEMNDASDGDWTINGAGHRVNHKYGFGAIDAEAAISTAVGWTNVGPEVSAQSGLISVNLAIPDGPGLNQSGPVVSDSFSVTDEINVEWVEVIFSATHSYRGDLEIELTSPVGTVSVLTEQHTNDFNDDFTEWSLTSARHWDELSTGDWTLSVSDGSFQDAGIWTTWELNVYGTLVPEPAASMLAAIGIFSLTAISGRRRRIRR